MPVHGIVVWVDQGGKQRCTGARHGRRRCHCLISPIEGAYSTSLELRVRRGYLLPSDTLALLFSPFPSSAQTHFSPRMAAVESNFSKKGPWRPESVKRPEKSTDGMLGGAAPQIGHDPSMSATDTAAGARRARGRGARGSVAGRAVGAKLGRGRIAWLKVRKPM